MSFEEFDFQFLDEGLESEIGFAGSDIFINFLEPENPVLANDNDPSLASVVSPGDDFLAYTSTDPWETFTKECCGEKKTQTSPWHESDSGMSDATLGSPQSYTQEDIQQILKTKSGSKQIKGMEFLAVDDVDIDVESFNQMSPDSSSAGLSPPSASQNVDEANNSDFDNRDENDRHALEFFKSDLFAQPSKVKVLSVQKHSNSTELCTGDRSNKNAIQAKINREKKKAYIQNLEDEIKALKSDNTKLASENTRMQRSTTELQEEVEYLKSVLINSSALSGLLKNISNVKEVKLSATIVGKKRSAEDDHNYNILESVPEKRARRINENLCKAGVCLHVNGGSACLEFCAHCSNLAQKSSAS